jgi:hypothetical protein
MKRVGLLGNLTRSLSREHRGSGALAATAVVITLFLLLLPLASNQHSISLAYFVLLPVLLVGTVWLKSRLARIDQNYERLSFSYECPGTILGPASIGHAAPLAAHSWTFAKKSD